MAKAAFIESGHGPPLAPHPLLRPTLRSLPQFARQKRGHIHTQPFPTYFQLRILLSAARTVAYRPSQCSFLLPLRPSLTPLLLFCSVVTPQHTPPPPHRHQTWRSTNRQAAVVDPMACRVKLRCHGPAAYAAGSRRVMLLLPHTASQDELCAAATDICDGLPCVVRGAVFDGAKVHVFAQGDAGASATGTGADGGDSTLLPPPPLCSGSPPVPPASPPQPQAQPRQKRRAPVADAPARAVGAASASASASVPKLRRTQAEHFRTKPCRNWRLDGSCRYQSRCKFLHAADDAGAETADA